jgi:hypothetical protein
VMDEQDAFPETLVDLRQNLVDSRRIPQVGGDQVVLPEAVGRERLAVGRPDERREA